MTETLFPAIPRDVEAAAEQLLGLACDSNLRLATAESCTGGLLAALLTDIEGAGHAFDRGFVVYKKEAKSDMLGIDPALIETYGVVSAEVAMAMAHGALARSQADIVCAVTCFAGQGKDGEQPGLVHLATGTREGVIHHREKRFADGSRGAVRIACLRSALDMMIQAARLTLQGANDRAVDVRQEKAG